MRVLGRDFLMLVEFSAAIKGFVFFDCRGASISSDVGRSRSLGRSSEGFCLLGGPTPITLDIHLKDSRVVNVPVDGGQCHGRIREDRIPFPEGPQTPSSKRRGGRSGPVLRAPPIATIWRHHWPSGHIRLWRSDDLVPHGLPVSGLDRGDLVTCLT
jgi:hypothetical protein